MAKLTIMQGLPGSGKSSIAQEIVKQGNTVRLNKDLIRTMLHFDKWSGMNESMTRDAARILAKHFLQKGVNVIIDDTNLNTGTVQSWKDLAKEMDAKIEYNRVETPMEECIRRDALRETGRVGAHVIIGMALQNGLYRQPENGFVLCDIDGTVADCTHRQHFLQGEKKDWKGFFEHMMADTPREDVVATLKVAAQDHQIIFVSARPDNYRTFTESWLRDNVGVDHVTLLMRHSGDKRPDVEVKQQIFDTYFKDKYPVHCVIDDRPSVIRMWELNGLKVINVGNGVEF